MGKTVTVDPATRVEGHARIVLELDDAGAVARGHLQVMEIRGFEKLVERMELFRMPLIVGRICGVCPAAQHLASVTAIENGLGISVPRDAALLRELLYMGHVLHSHTLSTFLLAGPDMFAGVDGDPGQRNVFGLLRIDPDLAAKALRLRSIGQQTVEIVGGRGIHPVTAVPGGMAVRPDREKLALVAGWGGEALELLAELSDRVRAGLERFAAFREESVIPFHSMALSQEGVVSFLNGSALVADPKGGAVRGFSADDYADHLVEHVMPASHMKSVRLRGETENACFVGPLARLNVNNFFCTPRANQALAEFQSLGRPRLSPLDYIEARLVEMLHCAERLVEIATDELADGAIRVDAVPGAGRFRGMVESPRGLLIHDYSADPEGRITAANLIVATQNNYDAMDAAITAAARHYLPSGDDGLLMNGMEFALRCFDPCLSCATHMAGRMPLEVEVRRGGEKLRTIARRPAR